MKQFLIVGPHRSGTTLVHHILRFHPQVSSLKDEVKVVPLFESGISAFTYGHETEDEYRVGFARAFQMLAGINAGPDTRAAGIKCALAFLEQAQILVDCCKTYLTDLDIILTVREDLLAQFGSLKRAESTGRWHSFTTADDDPRARITVDKDEYTEYFLMHTQIIKTIRSLAETHRCLELCYERDILHNASLYARLYDFLELDHFKPSGELPRKVAPAPEDFIEDYYTLKNLEPGLRKSGLAPQGRLDTSSKESHARSPMYRAWHLAGMGRRDDALEAAQLTGESDPHYYEAKCLCANIMTVNGDHEGAESEIQKAIARNARHPEAYLRRAELRRRQGRDDQALAATARRDCRDAELERAQLVEAILGRPCVRSFLWQAPQLQPGSRRLSRATAAVRVSVLLRVPRGKARQSPIRGCLGTRDVRRIGCDTEGRVGSVGWKRRRLWREPSSTLLYACRPRKPCAGA